LPLQPASHLRNLLDDAVYTVQDSHIELDVPAYSGLVLAHA
jgi:hypothetical protein